MAFRSATGPSSARPTALYVESSTDYAVTSLLMYITRGRLFTHGSAQAQAVLLRSSATVLRTTAFSPMDQPRLRLSYYEVHV